MPNQYFLPISERCNAGIAVVTFFLYVCDQANLISHETDSACYACPVIS